MPIRFPVHAWLLVFAALTSAFAVAHPNPNIPKLDQRLVSIGCLPPNPAFVFKLSHFQSKVRPAMHMQCSRMVDLDRRIDCLKRVLTTFAQPISASFEGEALPNLVTFKMEIWELDAYGNRRDDERKFSSIRTGHIDLDEQQEWVLRFDRDGFFENDEYALRIGPFHGNFPEKLAEIATVPVHRRFASDQLYVFFGCRLNWEP